MEKRKEEREPDDKPPKAEDMEHYLRNRNHWNTFLETWKREGKPGEGGAEVPAQLPAVEERKK